MIRTRTDLDCLAVPFTGFQLLRREADMDTVSLHVGREAVGKHERIGYAERPRLPEDLERPEVQRRPGGR
jgi:hypothetical protein